MILDPIVPEKGLIMLYATRGVGKTHLAVAQNISMECSKGAEGSAHGRRNASF